METNCPNCSNRLVVDDTKVPDTPFMLKCPKCQGTIKLRGKAEAVASPSPPTSLPPPPPASAPAPAPASAPPPPAASSMGPALVSLASSVLSNGVSADGHLPGPLTPGPAWMFVLTFICLPFRFVSNCFVSNSDWGNCWRGARKEAGAERRKALYVMGLYDRRYSSLRRLYGSRTDNATGTVRKSRTSSRRF